MRIGIDLGGTKIEGIALDDDGREVHRLRVPTPRDDYAATIAAIVAVVSGLERDRERSHRIGVGMPGAISPATGLVKNANSTWLNGRNFAEDLPAALGRPVRFENDANCLAVSEARDGAAAGARLVFAVIVGTGTGGGIAIDGAPWIGRNAIAGEWGHNALPWPDADEWPGPECYCGRRGCIETFLSGPALAREYAIATGCQADGPDVVARAESGESAAVAVMARYETRMARALASIINVLDPEVIVLGGGLSRIPRLYAEVPRLWSRWVFSDRVETRLLPAAHGDSSGVRGAAWLWDAVGAVAEGEPSD